MSVYANQGNILIIYSDCVDGIVFDFCKLNA